MLPSGHWLWRTCLTTVIIQTSSDMKKTDLSQCTIFDFPKITDPRGNLTFVEENRSIPFPVKRVYWTYDVPGGETRGGHAHKKLHQMLIAVSGSFHVVLDNGEEKRTILLNHPWQGLHIVPGVWRVLEDFSSGAVCMVIASEYYDEQDYIYEYDDFLKYLQGQ